MSLFSKFRNLAAPLSNVLKTTTSLQKTSVHSSAALQCTSSGDTDEGKKLEKKLEEREGKKLEKKLEEEIAIDFDWLSDPHKKRQPGHIMTLVPPIQKEWVDKFCDKAASLDIDVNKELVRSNISKHFYNKTYSYLCS